MSLSPREYIRLIHDYFGVDYAIVWDVATTKLSDLHETLGALLAELDNSESNNA